MNSNHNNLNVMRKIYNNQKKDVTVTYYDIDLNYRCHCETYNSNSYIISLRAECECTGSCYRQVFSFC